MSTLICTFNTEGSVRTVHAVHHTERGARHLLESVRRYGVSILVKDAIAPLSSE
jgi:hypothetical protein